MVEERFIFLITVVATLLSFSSQEKFSHVSQHFREELGDEVTVRSAGKTRGVVDLDDKSIVKRIKCNDLKIKVSLNNVSAAKEWRAGDVVLGSSQHGCNLHSVHPDQPGIYAKILTKTEMNNNRVDLTVEPAKPLDIFEDAKISVHVKRNTEMFHSRHKRSASSQQSVADFLTKPLKSIDWDKKVNTTIPFNSDEKVLALRKMASQKVPEVIVKDKAEFVEAIDPEFEFSCYNCVGDTTMAYHLEMVIKKDANNAPNVKTYISQIEGRSSGSYNFSIHSNRELTLSHTAKLWETSPIRVDILPLSRFHQLPSIFLEVNSSSIASLSVYATTVEGNVTVSGTFSTEGDYVVSKEYFSSYSPPLQQATVSNWTTNQGADNKVIANNTFYYNVNISQEIFIQPYITWAKKDVHLEFSSPFRMRFDQGIVASSKAIASAIQNEAMSNITGYFDTSDNIADVRAFGIQIWDVMMSKAEHQTESHITKHSLFSRSKANCFGDPIDLDSGYCGTPGPAILRTSDEFVNLKKIFGKVLVLFTDDEHITCTWCGQVGKQCRSCTEFEVDEERACADRLMTSSMATAITKLAKFVQAEWNDRKLIILDAWTEPTSQHPDGKYGNVTLYNEGRAARVGISKPLLSTPPSVEVDTDRSIFDRFKELLHCSGFPAAVIDTPDSVYEVCVAESQSYDRRKRKRRRRREAIANNTAISDDWQDEKERLTNIMIDLPEVIKYPDTLPDHLGFESIYPINETAESMCGASDEILRREHENCMKKFFQYPFDNAEFEAEGPPSSWCGTETRQCKQCSHLSDSPDPMEWCETRIMSARLIVRIYRLSKYVEKKVVKCKKPTIEKSINVSHNWTEDEFAQCRNGPAYESLSMKKCKDEMKLSEDKCTQCIEEWRCCMSGCLQGDCQSGGVCNEKNPFRQDIPSTPKCVPVDIMFVMDESESITSRNFDKMLVFAENLVQELNIGTGEAMIAFLTYSDSTRVHFNFSSYSTKEAVINAIRNVDYSSGGTNTAHALSTARTRYSSTYGKRSNALSLAIVLTDGRSNNKASTVTEAQNLLNHGVTVYCIGIGSNLDEDELKAIASNPNDHYLISSTDFDELTNKITRLAESLCINCRGEPLDLTFIVDSSSSLGSKENFKKELNFVSEVVNNLDFNFNDSRVSVITFSNIAEMKIPFGAVTGKYEFQEELNKIDWKKGNTYTDKALEMMYNARNDGRRNRLKIAVVVTDGKSTDPSSLEQIVKKIHNDGHIQMFAIGVGENINITELKLIASNNVSGLFVVNDFDELAMIESMVSSKICPITDNRPQPRCDANDPWKVKLFDNTCTGDPCLFLNGAGIYVLMKVLMLYEVCSPLRNDSTMETWMADTRSAYASGISLMDFLRECLDSCLKSLKINALKIHGGKDDPHIGIGISLKGDNPALMRKILNLSDTEYRDIFDNKTGITEKQALYLFGIVLRTKMKGLWRVIRYDELALLPTNVKIAIFNANYRGDFGQGVAAKFKKAVERGNWEGAVGAYLSHPDYQKNYECLTKGTHDICKRYNFNAKQFRSMINKTLTVGDSISQHNSSLCSSPAWFESLRQAGRAAKISVRKSYTLTSKELANLAVEAGFDFVEMSEGSIYVCVKSACGITTYIMQYPKLNLPSVCLPSEKEYQLPPNDNDTYSYPPLLDGGNQDLQLSDCYKIKDFRASNFRYFRLDTNLLECLDLASDYYGNCIDVVPDSGYRPHSLNNKNIGSRHQEEKWRFKVGMAAEVRPKDNTAENLEQMALTIMRSCIPGLRLKRLKLGMGTHHDRVYIDIRTSDNCIDFFQLWDVDNSELHDSINETYQQLMKGGPFIQPTNKEKACKEPAFGKENFYIKNPTKGLCIFDFSDRFCQDTQKHREAKAEELAEKLEAAAGANQFPKQLAREKTKACLVDTCGGCVGKGHKWEKKTRACLDLIQTFLEKSTSPFPIDKMVDNTAFFNTENADSHVHSLACHDGSACIEDVQLHSILIKIVNEKFKPDPSKSSEELIFDPGHNPTPLLDIVEQEMAMKASGNVSIYIEKDTDMSSFYHLIKILMVYNRNVGFVNFHITKDVKEDRIAGSIQKKIERWAQSSCPKRTRILVAPYDIQIVSESRRKRSIERSAERNLRIHNMRNWEMNWLMTMT